MTRFLWKRFELAGRRSIPRPEEDQEGEMSQRIFFLTRLQGDSEGDDFEQFVEDVLLPLVRKIPSVESYEVSRIEGLVFDEDQQELPWDFVDVIDVTDVEAYEADVGALMQTPEGATFEEQWGRFVEDWVTAYGEILK